MASNFLRASLAGMAFVSAIQAAQFRFPQVTFTLPDGFTMEQVAGPPLVDRPMMACFDDQGRLYVADSSGSNEPVQKQLEKKPHRIVRLEDADGDGHFDKSVVFADQLMFPEGVLWHDGAVYTGAPPTIWKLVDTDGDGKADQRTEWFQGKTLTGCANDLHGPYLGPDGWIYWCKGAFAKQTHERPGRAPVSDNAAHVFRCRPDGSAFDSVMSGGMDNPVEVAWSPEGEFFFITTFFHNPEAGKRDAVVHCIYGGAYPKVHGAIDEVRRTGDLLPPLVELGPAAACALTALESSAFGPEFTGNLFSTEFNLRKVMRHILEPDGPTYRSVNQDFLVADNPDFHPTDVFEDADGSLLVIDTGGWYKICCPTSQLPKPDVLGAIYRIKRQGMPAVNDPRGLKIDWAHLSSQAMTELLGDGRPVVRRRATQELARTKAVPALAAALKSSNTALRRQAVWSLMQMDGPGARAAVRQALQDSSESVRRVALHGVAMHRDVQAADRAVALLKSDSLMEARKAAEAVACCANSAAVPALLEAAGQFRGNLSGTNLAATTRIMEHSLIFALEEIGDAAATGRGLDSSNPAVQRAALIALDQMANSPLEPATVIRFLSSSEPLLKQTANWIVGHRPSWGAALAEFHRGRLLQTDRPEAERAESVTQLAVLSRDPAIQDLLAQTASAATAPVPARIDALRAMARAGLKETPAAWWKPLTAALVASDEAVRAQAISTTRNLSQPKNPAPEIAAALLATAGEAQRPATLRLEALAAVPGGVSELSPSLFAFVTMNLAPTNTVVGRSQAASILARAKLSSEQALALADLLRTAGSMELPKLLSTFEGATNEALGLRILDALQASPGVASLTPDSVRRLVAAFPASVQEKSAGVQKLLAIDVTAMNARVESFLAGIQAGDVRRGQVVFNSQKAACSSCHAMGYVGGRVGPDLTSIGQIRTERDLIEAILYPSASFVRSYEPMIVATKDGEDYSGVVRRDTADEIVLATGPETEQRIPRENVAEIRAGTVSTMPAGLEEQLSRQELVDLVVFLKNTKWGAQ